MIRINVKCLFMPVLYFKFWHIFNNVDVNMHFVDKILSVGCICGKFMSINLKCEFRKRKSNRIDCPTGKIYYFILN